MKGFDILKSKHREWSVALEEEIAFQRESGGRRYRLSDGILLNEDGGEHFYSFLMDADVALPDNAPVRVEVEGKPVRGKVVEVEGFEITLALEDYIGDRVDSTDLYCEPWELLKALKERLDEALEERGEECRLAAMLFTSPEKKRDLKVRYGQEAAVEAASKHRVSFVWGPPGTGKTETLARIADTHILKNHRVLILSHNNVAFDGAILRIGKLLAGGGRLHRGLVVRWGFARLPEIRDHPFLLASRLAESRFPELAQSIRKLTARNREMSRQMRNLRGSASVELGAELAELKNRLKEIRALLRDEEVACAERAEVLGVTFSKAVADPAMRDWLFHHVVVDEASMAYIPQVAFAATRARKSLVIAGDFRQLPPIALARTDAVDRWLTRDIFDETGVSSAVEKGKAPFPLVMLREQWRMHPRISAIPNKVAYAGLLRDRPEVEGRTRPITMSNPFSGQPVVFVDLSGAGAVAYKDYEGSHFNILSALVCTFLAGHALEQRAYVAVITPYAAQARLVLALTRDLFGEKLNPRGGSEEGVVAATVHRFQGSDRDVVI